MQKDIIENDPLTVDDENRSIKVKISVSIPLSHEVDDEDEY